MLVKLGVLDPIAEAIPEKALTIRRKHDQHKALLQTREEICTSFSISSVVCLLTVFRRLLEPSLLVDQRKRGKDVSNSRSRSAETRCSFISCSIGASMTSSLLSKA